MMLDYLFAERTVASYAATHDIVIVSFHGGAEGAAYTHVTFAEEEYYNEPRGDVVRFARTMVDAGADLVLGSGPHVVRAMERYNERLIAYSLGNFATSLGISVDGIKGVAPILLATLDGEGRFIEAEIISTVQGRGTGPRIDPHNKAFDLLRSLSIQDFKTPGLVFRDDGKLLPAERPPVPRRTVFGPDDKPGDNGPKACSEDWFWFLESSLLKAGEISFDVEPGDAAWRTIVQRRLNLDTRQGLSDLTQQDWCDVVSGSISHSSGEIRLLR